MTQDELANFFDAITDWMDYHSTLVATQFFWFLFVSMVLSLALIGSTSLSLASEIGIVVAGSLVPTEAVAMNGLVLIARKKTTMKIKRRNKLAELEERNRELEIELELDSDRRELVH